MFLYPKAGGELPWPGGVNYLGPTPPYGGDIPRPSTEMTWWEIVCEKVNPEDVFYTPGSGKDGGKKQKPFFIISKDASKISILSGHSPIPLTKECFNIVEEALMSKKYLWLRIAAIREKDALENSADKLIKQGTGSYLARANYVCALLEHYKLVKYAMKVRKKVIELP